jgi:hypothetical protein
MAHTVSIPPIWDLLDRQPSAETLRFLSLVEFTDLLNGYSSDDFVRNAFVITPSLSRYLHLKSQELHEAHMSAHETIGEAVKEKVYL